MFGQGACWADGMFVGLEIAGTGQGDGRDAELAAQRPHAQAEFSRS